MSKELSSTIEETKWTFTLGWGSCDILGKVLILSGDILGRVFISWGIGSQQEILGIFDRVLIFIGKSWYFGLGFDIMGKILAFSRRFWILFTEFWHFKDRVFLSWRKFSYFEENFEREFWYFGKKRRYHCSTSLAKRWLQWRISKSEMNLN